MSTITLHLTIEAPNLEAALTMLQSGQYTTAAAANPAPSITGWPGASVVVPVGTAVAPAATPAPQAQNIAEPPPPMHPASTAPTMPAQGVPTAAPAYTQEELMRAASALMDAGQMAQLQQVMASMGVSAFTELPKERYGEFAMAIKALGAKL